MSELAKPSIQEFIGVTQGKEYNLLELSETETVYLKGLVQKSAQPVRMFMHPFCNLHRMYNLRDGSLISVPLTHIALQASGEYELTDEQKDLLNFEMGSRRGHNYICQDLRYINGDFTEGFNHYLSILVRILRANPPLIFLAEEYGHVRETAETFRELGYRNDLVYYNTCELDPSPKGYKDMVSEGHRLIAGCLSSIGIQDLIIGGQYLMLVTYPYASVDKAPTNVFKFIQPESPFRRNGKSYHLTKCVGAFVNGFYRLGFNLAVSTATFPDFHP